MFRYLIIFSFMILTHNAYAVVTPFIMKNFQAGAVPPNGATTGQPMLASSTNGHIYLVMDKKVHKFYQGVWSRLTDYPNVGKIKDVKVGPDGLLYFASAETDRRVRVKRLESDGSYSTLWSITYKDSYNAHLPTISKMRLSFLQHDNDFDILVGTVVHYRDGKKIEFMSLA